MMPRASGLLFFALCALGCAENTPPSPAERLIGAWYLEGAPPPCAFGAVFGADGAYEAVRLCPLEGGTWGAELEEGDYSASDEEISFTPRRNSCRSMRSDEPYSLDYAFPSDDTLRVRQASGVLILERAPRATPNGVSVAYGCNEDGHFIAEDLGPF